MTCPPTFLREQVAVIALRWVRWADSDVSNPDLLVAFDLNCVHLTLDS